jgi:adenosylcobinamide kinase / adenosylcobinamide-phosphate guanylyltransferase
MKLIIGGRHQGKLDYAMQTYGVHLSAADLQFCHLSESLTSGIITNVQEEVRFLLRTGENPLDSFKRYENELADKILIGDEIGNGIVPVSSSERRWRDETGFVYQYLAQKADRVDRVWAGLGQKIKG